MITESRTNITAERRQEQIISKRRVFPKSGTRHPAPTSGTGCRTLGIVVKMSGTECRTLGIPYMKFPKSGTQKKLHISHILRILHHWRELSWSCGNEQRSNLILQMFFPEFSERQCADMQHGEQCVCLAVEKIIRWRHKTFCWGYVACSSKRTFLVRCKAANLWNYVVCPSVVPSVCISVDKSQISHMQPLQRTINAVRDFFIQETIR